MNKRKVNAEIIADSVNPRGERITTFILTYPRFIHAEVMTHRMFSRNAASSRAIPHKKMLKSIKDDPFVPIAWQKDHKGMQGTEYLQGEAVGNRRALWLAARDAAILWAEQLNIGDVTKQITNRLLEPFMWYTNLVTVTEMENFFDLRCPKYHIRDDSKKEVITYKSRKDATKNYPECSTNTELDWIKFSGSGAEIHIQALAESMWDARNESTPNELKAGEWHIPFSDKFNKGRLSELGKYEDVILKIATARAARLSYMTFDGEIDYEKDIQLHDMLLKNKHASPFEHCARAMTNEEYITYTRGTIELLESEEENEIGYLKIDIEDGSAGWCNNFRGFIQYRYMIDNNQFEK